MFQEPIYHHSAIIEALEADSRTLQHSHARAWGFVSLVVTIIMLIWIWDLSQRNCKMLQRSNLDHALQGDIAGGGTRSGERQKV